MALSKTVETNHGLGIENAYIRIDEQSGNKEKLNIRVRLYVSQEKARNEFGWIEEKLYEFAPNTEEDSENFIKQGYEFLKTLDEYKDAVDIF